MSTENIWKKSKGKKGKSNSDAMREMREKSANKAKTPAAKAKKSPAPAKQPKPAKDKPAKVAKSKPSQTALVPTIDADQLNQLKSEAQAGEKQLESSIPEYIAKGAQIYTLMDDFKKRELWKFTEITHKSWTSFVEYYATLAKVSVRTLFGVIGATKALPGVSAETKKNIGARKLQQLAKAARTAAKKGKKVPQSIIDAAEKETVAQFSSTLQQEGFVETPPPPAPEFAPMFPQEETLIRDLYDHGKAAPFDSEPTHNAEVVKLTGSSVVDEAIATAIKVYDPTFTIENALEFVAKQFLLSEYTGEREDFYDKSGNAIYTNTQAASAILEESKPKKAKPAKA